MKKLKTFISLLLSLVLIVGCTEKQSKNDIRKLEAEIQQTLNQIQNEVEFIGITCAIIMPDNSIIELASGYSDLDENIKMNTTHRMFSGSTGKTFVGAALLKLLEEGKLSLDDKVSKYLGEYPWYKRIPNSDELTINMLAHHTGGLPRYIFSEKFNDDVLVDVDKIWTPEERLSYIFDVDAIHPAGQGWYYSDTDYIVLGMIIEKITSNSFYNEVTTRFLEPYSLTTTEPAITRTHVNLAQGHSGDNPYINAPTKTVNDGKYFINPQLEWCGGGFISGISDLAKWAKLYFGGTIFNEVSKSELHSTVDFETGQESKEGYSIAAIVSETSVGKKIGHTGLMMGYITEMGYYEKYDFAVALQINQDHFQGKEKNLEEYSLIVAEIVAESLKL